MEVDLDLHLDGDALTQLRSEPYELIPGRRIWLRQLTALEEYDLPKADWKVVGGMPADVGRVHLSSNGALGVELLCRMPANTVARASAFVQSLGRGEPGPTRQHLLEAVAAWEEIGRSLIEIERNGRSPGQMLTQLKALAHESLALLDVTEGDDGTDE